jgi:hypothetical protein
MPSSRAVFGTGHQYGAIISVSDLTRELRTVCHALLIADGDSALNGAAKFVEAAGKGPLSLVAFLVLVLAFLIYRFFAKERLLWRGVALSAMIACIFAFIFLLAVPKPNALPPVAPMKCQQRH